MASAILVDHHGYRELYVTQENGDQNFTEEAQDLFEEYSTLVEGVLEGVGIGQDYDLAETENMVVVNADPNIDTLASSDLEMNVLQVAIDHMIEHLEDVSYCVDDGMYAEDVAKQIRLEDEGRLEAAKRLKERLA
tara:strand:+ start:219 stop:623 length:405 start_codon:yes stop_codon:yes gene_type:complete